MTDRPPPPSWQIAVAFAILYIVWGTTYLAIQIGVLNERLPPLLFGGARIGSAGLILLAVQVIRRERLTFARSDWPGLAIGALLLFVVGNGLISIALQTVPSGETAVLAATTTLWIAAFSKAFPGGDRLRPAGWLGLLFGFVGVVVLEWPALQEQGVVFAGNIGFWLVLTSAAAWGIGTVLLRKTTIRAPRFTSVGWQMTIAGICMIALGFLRGESPPATITVGIVGAFLYLLVFGSLIAYMAFHWLLEHVPAPKVSTYAYVNPLVAVVLGTWLHGELLSVSLVLGMLLIFAAVFLMRSSS